jgi:hypothetical protein
MQDLSHRRTRHDSSRFSRRLNLTFGEKVLVLYFTAFYFMPMITDFFIDVPIKYILQGDLQFLGAFLFAAGYLITFLLIRKTVNLSFKLRVPLRSKVVSPWLTTAIFLLFLVFAARFSMQFTSSFRHTESYSSAGLIPVLTFALKTVCTVLIFSSISSKSLVKLEWYHFIIFLISISLSFVGSYDILYVATALYAWFRLARVNVLRLIRPLFSKADGIIMLLLLPGIVFAGMANKIGFDRAVGFFADGGLAAGLELFANRTFYHSYSLAFQLNNYLGTFHLGREAVEIVSFQSIRRFQVLLGSSVPNETLQTVSRLNFLIISGNNIDSDAGASPGLLGSIFYLPGSLYMLPLHMFCLYNAISIFDNIMGKSKYGLLAYLCGIVLLQALTDSFMDNFNPFSIGFIVLATLFFISSYARTVADPADQKR